MVKSCDHAEYINLYLTFNFFRLNRHNRLQHNRLSGTHLEVDGSAVGRYNCDVCNFETKYGFNLNAHFKSLKHISNTKLSISEDSSSLEEEATCKICRITFMSRLKR